MSDLDAELVEILRGGLRQLPEPVQLASGDMSRWFVDCKKALARGSDLARAGKAIVELVAARGVGFDAVGGLTMGADSISVAIAIASDTDWFSVRKAQKDRGTRQRIEGAVLDERRNVLLVDDVVTRGGSIIDALHAIQETGATVVAAVCLVDRGEHGSKAFAELGIPYWPIVTYQQLGIPAVGDE